jgi:hypothetical protein
MRRLTLAAVAVLGVFASLATGRASAQYNPPSYGNVYGPTYGNYGRAGPALSPYLNLTRGGNPAANYFLGVLPEIDRRRNQAEVARDITDLDRRVDMPAVTPPLVAPPGGVETELTGGGLPPTGHAAAFGNYGSYYAFPNPGSAAPRGPQAGQSRGR